MRVLVPFLCLAAVAKAPTPTPFSHEAYVWQRQWTPALERALVEAQPHVTGWRVLASDWPVMVDVPLESLRAGGRPVVPVFRLGGRLRDSGGAPRALADLVRRWRAAGLEVTGVELDHDCAESQLRTYRAFLQAVRRETGDLRLSITALPSWLASRELPGLLATVDESILQVHAVANPRRGLLPVDLAREWMRRWAEASPGPFRVALPTYGSRVSWDAVGRVTAIESESPRYGSDAESEELFASPVEVGGLLAEWRRRPPERWRGVVWFRLPTDEDRRAWSFDTWRAVMRGADARARVSVWRESTGDIVVENGGRVDGEMPALVRVDGGPCAAADGLAGYEWTGAEFRRRGRRPLRAGERVVIGWVRCEEGARVRLAN